jgi:hypothetical protein
MLIARHDTPEFERKNRAEKAMAALKRMDLHLIPLRVEKVSIKMALDYFKIES